MSNKKKNPTIYDVAERSGISIATISRVLNSPEKVNPETRSIVLDAIDKLGFVPKAEARARALSKTNRIGVITPFFTAPSFVQRLRASHLPLQQPTMNWLSIRWIHSIGCRDIFHPYRLPVISRG